MRCEASGRQALSFNFKCPQQSRSPSCCPACWSLQVGQQKTARNPQGTGWLWQNLFVESRRRCRVSTSSSLLDLDSQDPFAIGTLFRNRSSRPFASVYSPGVRTSSKRQLREQARDKPLYKRPCFREIRGRAVVVCSPVTHGREEHDNCHRNSRSQPVQGLELLAEAAGRVMQAQSRRNAWTRRTNDTEAKAPAGRN